MYIANEYLDVCNNCTMPFDPTIGGVVAKTHEGNIACAICEFCLSGALLIKIVLRRTHSKPFTYEQFQALEMTKPVMPIPKKP